MKTNLHEKFLNFYSPSKHNHFNVTLSINKQRQLQEELHIQNHLVSCRETKPSLDEPYKYFLWSLLTNIVPIDKAPFLPFVLHFESTHIMS